MQKYINFISINYPKKEEKKMKISIKKVDELNFPFNVYSLVFQFSVCFLFFCAISSHNIEQ